jgi:hypothetical protein
MYKHMTRGRYRVPVKHFNIWPLISFGSWHSIIQNLQISYHLLTTHQVPLHEPIYTSDEARRPRTTTASPQIYSFIGIHIEQWDDDLLCKAPDHEEKHSTVFMKCPSEVVHVVIWNISTSFWPRKQLLGLFFDSSCFLKLKKDVLN